MLALTYSSTRTVDGLQKLWQNDTEVFSLSLLFISAFWSMATLIRGPLSQVTLAKGGLLNLKGKLLLAFFFTIGAIARVTAILFCLAPSLGLFNLIWHYKKGSIPIRSGDKKIYDVINKKSITFEAVWKPIKKLTDLTVVGPIGASLLLFITFLLIFFFAFCILKKFSKKIRTEKSLSAKMFHILSLPITISPFKDFDECAMEMTLTKDNESAFKENMITLKQSLKKELGSLLILSGLANILLCIPLWLLSVNIALRNNFLDDYFHPLSEEAESTKMAIKLTWTSVALCLLTPLAQTALLWLYYEYGHPWCLVWRNLKKNTKLKETLEMDFKSSKENA